MPKRKQSKRGGKRIGAGRPKTKEDTKVMRIPKSKEALIRWIIQQEVVGEGLFGRVGTAGV